MQSFLTVLENFKENYLAWVSVLNITVSKTDIVEMLIIAFLFYHVLKWIKDTRAWMLLKGILVILAFTCGSNLPDEYNSLDSREDD